MTTTNTAVAQEQAKPLTKMDHARALFKEIYTAGYKFKIEGAKSQRNEFIKRAINEFGMTQAGAATYFQNLTNEAKGDPVYKYTKKKKTGTTTGEAGTATGALNETTTQATTALTENKDLSPSAGEVGKFRWIVQNAAGEELSSHPTRSEAQAKAKELGVEWADRKAQPQAEQPAE